MNRGGRSDPPSKQGQRMSKTSKHTLGGIIHTYQKYDPLQLPGPRSDPPDLVTPAFDHWLRYGHLRELSPEELAKAVRLDPSQIAGLGPSLDSLIQRLLERKRKILETYETDEVLEDAAQRFQETARRFDPPGKWAKRYEKAIREEQLYDLEQLYYATGSERDPLARHLVQLMDRLADKYQVEELAQKYAFTGQTTMTIPEALEIKAELEQIDKLLKQLEEAKQTAQLAIIDWSELSEYAEPGEMEQLRQLQQQIEEFIRQTAERQGLEAMKEGYRLTPKALRIFQSRLLDVIFSDLQAAKSGRHQGLVLGEGAIETQKLQPYEFGDSITHMDIPTTLINAMIRETKEAGPAATASQPGSAPRRVRLKAEDIVIHQTRNHPKCATAVLLDMSGSMRYGGLYVDVKRMGLALDGLIRTEYPGDFLQFIEMYTFAKPRHVSEVVNLLPKPVTVDHPVVRLKADMSNPNLSEWDLPPHFTNIQHALQMGRQFLAVQDTPNRQIILITDGLPTAHFDGKELYMLYPPDPRTEEATLREARLCAREGITINLFLLSNWNQSEEDVQFAYRIAETTQGRVLFVAGRQLDRFVVWDYMKRRREIIG